MPSQKPPIARIGCLLTGVLVATGCGSDTPPGPTAPTGPLLQILDPSGTIQVGFTDLERWLTYSRSVDRKVGKQTRIASILHEHLIPLRLAERDHREARTTQLERARALLSAAGGRNGGPYELRAKGKNVMPPDWPQRFGRGELPLAVDEWLFAAENIGRISDPIPTAQGYWLACPIEHERGSSRIYDAVKAVTVHFLAPEGEEFRTWLDRARDALATAPIRVHPDYESALPGGLMDAWHRQTERQPPTKTQPR